MVYIRFHLSIILNSWFFCQLISSTSKFNNRALVIVKSIDDYLCQNYILTCYFRQRYHKLFDEEKSNDCKSLLIIHSCLYYDRDSIRMCSQFTLNQVKTNLTNETPLSCFTSSIYKVFYTQRLHSIALSRITTCCPILVFFLLFILFIIRKTIYY
ncbi:unnamed protein product [Adineta steineri]|uniref:Uncharacterized protein n=1 Tax=Adineta steineri TaxID=433720 RepID=A0A813R1U5_9BILA|nr:unnamed protein product [Adineta steineri]